MSDENSKGRRAGIGGLAGGIADAVISRMDLNALVSQIDVDDLLEQADVNRLLDRVDNDRLLEQVDVNRLLDRVDNDRLLEQVDVNRLLDRVDVNRLLDRVDVDRLLDRVGIEDIVRRAGIAEIVRQSTNQVAGSALDVVRRQIVGLDVILMRVLGGFLVRRRGGRLGPASAGPSGLVTAQATVPRPDAANLPLLVSGRYAGLLSQVLAFAGDLALATAAFTAVTAMVSWILATVVSVDTTGAQGPLWLIGLITWWLLYWWGTLSLQGRTPVMGLLGLRLVTRDGQPMPSLRVLLWVLALPFSTLLFGAGFLVMLLDREQRTLQDRVARASVIYDWGNRAALVPSPLGRWIEAHAP
ncbi:hypothetical protein BH23ACT9_BH23ACT9_29220 [soil metagenome]